MGARAGGFGPLRTAESFQYRLIQTIGHFDAFTNVTNRSNSAISMTEVNILKVGYSHEEVFHLAVYGRHERHSKLKEKLRTGYQFAARKIGEVTAMNERAAQKRPGWVLFLGAVALASAVFLGIRLLDGVGEAVMQWISMTFALSVRIVWLSILGVVGFIALLATQAAFAAFFGSDQSKKPAVPPVDPNPFEQKS